jgi:hypothetical protein
LAAGAETTSAVVAIRLVPIAIPINGIPGIINARDRRIVETLFI